MPEWRALEESHARQMAILLYLVRRVWRIEQKIDQLTEAHNEQLRRLAQGLGASTRKLTTAVKNNP